LKTVPDALFTKDITIRILTEKQAKDAAKYLDGFNVSPLLKTKRITMEYSPSVSLLEMTVFDKKKIMFSTSPEKQEKTTWLYSNNPFMVEMGRTYFETLWNTAQQKN